MCGLAAVVEAWPTLPDAVRKGIVATVAAAGKARWCSASRRSETQGTSGLVGRCDPRRMCLPSKQRGAASLRSAAQV